MKIIDHVQEESKEEQKEEKTIKVMAVPIELKTMTGDITNATQKRKIMGKMIVTKLHNASYKILKEHTSEEHEEDKGIKLFSMDCVYQKIEESTHLQHI